MRIIITQKLELTVFVVMLFLKMQVHRLSCFSKLAEVQGKFYTCLINIINIIRMENQTGTGLQTSYDFIRIHCSEHDY